MTKHTKSMVGEGHPTFERSKNMKATKCLTLSLAAVLLVQQGASGQCPPSPPVGTAFTYQGFLTKGPGVPVTDDCTFWFDLYPCQTGGTLIARATVLDVNVPLPTLCTPASPVSPPYCPPSPTICPVTVSHGHFTVHLEFGDLYQGDARFLEITVECPGAFGCQTLAPRQELTPVPYALFAGKGPGGAGGPDGDWDFTNPANMFAIPPDNDLTANVGIGTRTPTEKLDVDGNIHASGTITSGSTITIDGTVNPNTISSNHPDALELHVASGRALRLEPDGTSPNLIGGFSGNNVTPDEVFGATIGGGGSAASSNLVTDNFGTIGGGGDNEAGNANADTTDATYGTVAGGQGNTASGAHATVGGGLGNTASNEYGTVGGGSGNSAINNAHATVGGGSQNTASGKWSTVGGGSSSTGSGTWSTVGGGLGNDASGSVATVSGGQNNIASNPWSTVGGGIDNEALAEGATIGGGGPVGLDCFVCDGGSDYGRMCGVCTNDLTLRCCDDIDCFAAGPCVPDNGNCTPPGLCQPGVTSLGNRVTQPWGTIGGGSTNTAGNWYATVGGGIANTAGGETSTIAGGQGNTASGARATVGGGTSNTASHIGATIGGGYNNDAGGGSSTVGGGANNTAGVSNTTVSGGRDNTASGFRATVSGGFRNAAAGADSTVGGGANNTASSGWSTVGGGDHNIAREGAGATVGGGVQNLASGNSATVPGGSQNVAAGTYSFAAGRLAKANNIGTFVWADSDNNSNFGEAFASTGTDQFLIRAAGGVGIGTPTPQSALQVVGNYVQITTVTGRPPATDCDQATEAGRMVVVTDDPHNAVLCVCSGIEWKCMCDCPLFCGRTKAEYEADPAWNVIDRSGHPGPAGLDDIKGKRGRDLIIGTRFDDEIDGKGDADCIYGGDGNDIIHGDKGLLVIDSGDDEVYGGRGRDRINGDAGNDHIYGGPGDDQPYSGDECTLFFPRTPCLKGDSGDDHIYGGDGNDYLKGDSGEDRLFGEDGNDYLKGDAQIDRLFGGDGDDTIVGNSGRDRICGGEGDDWIDGSGDRDWIDGGPGTDTCNGGGAPALADVCFRCETCQVCDCRSGCFAGCPSCP